MVSYSRVCDYLNLESTKRKLEENEKNGIIFSLEILKDKLFEYSDEFSMINFGIAFGFVQKESETAFKRMKTYDSFGEELGRRCFNEKTYICKHVEGELRLFISQSHDFIRKIWLSIPLNLRYNIVRECVVEYRKTICKEFCLWGKGKDMHITDFLIFFSEKINLNLFLKPRGIIKSIHSCDQPRDSFGIFSIIPVELLFEILSVCDWEDFIKLQLVSKGMNAFSNEDEMWKMACSKRKFVKTKDFSWKISFYKEWATLNIKSKFKI